MTMPRGLSPQSADEELLTGCLEGDQSAWNALVVKYRRLVYSIPLRYRLPAEDAADVFQAVWVDLYRDLDKIENAASLRGWLSTATARRSLLVRKRRQKELGMSEADETLADPGPDLTAIRSAADRDQLLREACARLSDRCRRMIEMLFFEQPPRPYKEVADSLGLAEGSIGFIRGRCLKKLRQELERLGG